MAYIVEHISGLEGIACTFFASTADSFTCAASMQHEAGVIPGGLPGAESELLPSVLQLKIPGMFEKKSKTRSTKFNN